MNLPQVQSRPNSFISNQSATSIDHGPYQPGNQLRINNRIVVVESFIAEGGFAHVYTCLFNNERMVLKRISCPDQITLQELIREAEIHRELSGHFAIVQFIDYTYQPITQGFELLILMEYCAGGHLVDYLNARLHNRPKEPEILSIFAQICQGVAYMHSKNPPIIHRDLKIENVLLSNNQFKICDFGSCTTEVVIPKSLTVQEIRRLEEEIAKFTTIQYRAPEQCDLYQRKGLNEKVDVWAMGVLLFKLCFYTTPFEDSGKMGILSGTVNIPSHPSYSQQLLDLILMLLQTDVETRPDIYQVYYRVCQLRGVPYNLAIVFVINKAPKPLVNPIAPVPKDIPIGDGPFRETNRVGNLLDDVVKIEPMRRGRPSKSSFGSQELLSGKAPAFDDTFGSTMNQGNTTTGTMNQGNTTTSTMNQGNTTASPFVNTSFSNTPTQASLFQNTLISPPLPNTMQTNFQPFMSHQMIPNMPFQQPMQPMSAAQQPFPVNLPNFQSPKHHSMPSPVTYQPQHLQQFPSQPSMGISTQSQLKNPNASQKSVSPNSTSPFTPQHVFSNAPWPETNSIVPPPKPPRARGQQTDGRSESVTGRGDAFVSKMVDKFNKP